MPDSTSENLVLEALGDDQFVRVSKKLMRFFKGDGSAAAFLSELVSAYKYHLNNQTIEPDGAFPIPAKRYQTVLGLTCNKQARILEACMRLGVADLRLMGFPAIKYVKLNFDAIRHILENDELKYKKIDSAAFYAQINLAANNLESYTVSFTPFREACDNMADLLVGTIMLISKRCVEHGRKVEWTPELLGRVRTWVNNRSKGKAFDFTIITRTMDTMQLLPGTQFYKFIADFLLTARGIQDNHFLQQVYDYTEFLPEPLWNKNCTNFN
jgi:hypothetical protein